MNALMEGLNSLLDISILLYMLVGLVLGFMVGAFPGITATMAVALAAGFTMTLEPVQGLAVLLTIYVLLWGVAMASGQISEPFTDGMKRIVRMCIIVGFALTAGIYQSTIVDLFNQAPAQLANAITQGTDFAQYSRDGYFAVRRNGRHHRCAGKSEGLRRFASGRR